MKRNNKKLFVVDDLNSSSNVLVCVWKNSKGITEALTYWFE
jgi:hypothetical protein